MEYDLRALVKHSVMWRERQPVRRERTVGRSVGDNPVCDGFEQGGFARFGGRGCLWLGQ
jgi:hypothetical protein